MSTSKPRSRKQGFSNATDVTESPVTQPTTYGNIADLVPPLPEALAQAMQASEEDNETPIATRLPRPLPVFPRFYALDEGCYLVKYSPLGQAYHYDGSIRVQKDGSNTVASGDLYYHKPISIWPLQPVRHDKSDDPRQDLVFPVPSLFGEPNPANGIPIFSRKNYRYYLRITQILENFSFSKTFTLGFQMWRFNGVAANPMWNNEGDFAASMTFTSAPAGYPSGADYLTGSVKNQFGTVVGNLSMGWVSKYLRRATVEIDRVRDTESPLDSGLGHSWQSVFDKVGWKIDVVQSSTNVTEVSGDSWSDGEMHAGMLAWRDAVNLDAQWRYHIIAVNLIDSTPRGIMYDAGATDSNNIPREGIGIASHWMIPNANPWGKVKGVRFGAAKAPYFRTALHEIGHAMGLYHNTVDFGIMNTTDVIAAGAAAPVQFPDNIKWEHAPDDQKKLRHFPDMFVRPGGIPFGTSYGAHPLSPDDEEEAVGLQLDVNAVTDVVPIGAPVRFEITLKNLADVLLPVPASISMKSGNVKGRVIDPSGAVRTFSPLIICVDDHPLRYLGVGEQITDSLTLLRGAEGALFAAPGVYTVEVEVSWDLNGGQVSTTGQSTVYVTSAKDTEHAKAAMNVLSTPDTLLSLVLTGDHLKEGNRAIQDALANDVLRPHFAYIEAKRYAQDFGQRKADIKTAATLIDRDTVMSKAEIKKAEKLMRKASAKADEYSHNDISAVLKVLADKADAREEAKQKTSASPVTA